MTKSRFRLREGRAGRWRDGGANSGGLEGVENVSFSCYIPCHNMSISGRRRPRGPFGWFSGPPSQGPTEGSREPRRGAGPAERRRRVRSVEGRGRVKHPEMSSPGDSQLRTPDAIREDRPVGRRDVAQRSSSSASLARESRLGIRSSKPTTVKKSTYEFLRSNQEAGRDLRAQPSD